MSPISPAAFQRSSPPHDCIGSNGLAVGTHVVCYGEGLAIVTDEYIELAARAGRGLRTQDLQG
jgi:hypothetical protein